MMDYVILVLGYLSQIFQVIFKDIRYDGGLNRDGIDVIQFSVICGTAGRNLTYHSDHFH